jgi:hypothetical protein
MVTSPVTVVPIEQIFDIAQARSTLRAKIVHQRWPVMFNARASAVLTALGELILECRDTQCVAIKIEIIPSPRPGVKLYTTFRLSEEPPILWHQRLHNLKMAATDTEINDSGGRIEITTHVWIE